MVGTLCRKTSYGEIQNSTSVQKIIFKVQHLRWVTPLRSIKFFSLLIISLWDICNNIQVDVEFLALHCKFSGVKTRQITSKL